MSKRKNEGAAAGASSEANAKEMDGVMAKKSAAAEKLPETKKVPAGGSKATKTVSCKMYVGPTVTGFAIQTRVYTDIPDGAKERLKEVPELANLFIEIRDYPKANKMLRERTGYIYSAFTKALELRK